MDFTFLSDRDRVAVLRLEGRNVSQGVADAVTERLGFFLGRTTFAHVLERDYIEDIMEEIGFQTEQIASEDIDPAIGISRMLGAEKIIAGLVSKAGNSFSLQNGFYSVFDLRSSSNKFLAILYKCSFSLGCDGTDLRHENHLLTDFTIAA